MKRLFLCCAAGVLLAGCSAAPGAARITPVGPTADPLVGPASGGLSTIQPGSVPSR